MPVNTVLRVLRFSGYYPSCSHCLKRVTVIRAAGVTQRPRRYECRTCGMSWLDEAELAYRYCVTVAVQTTDLTHSEVVVFGESLNPVFGAHAAHLHRFLKSHVVPDHSPTLDAHLLFHVLTEPLQAILSGRCFSASLTHQNCRENTHCCDIVTNFKLLGSPNVTVLSLLTKHLSCAELTRPDHLWCEIEETAIVCESADGKRARDLPDSNSSSLLSIICSSATQYSRNVLLESYYSDNQRSVCDNTSLKLEDTTLQELHTSHSLSEYTTTALCAVSSPPIHTVYYSPYISSVSSLSLNSMPVCATGNNILFDPEPTTVCCKSTPSFQEMSPSLSTLHFSDDLPDSESFLEEFQCDFERVSPLSHTSSHSVCVNPNFTPELFSHSPLLFPVSSNHSDDLSPELFGSQDSITSSNNDSSSRLVPNDSTPSVRQCVRAVPKRCLLQSLHRSLHCSWNTAHTPLGKSSRDNSRIEHCFSPELFS